MNKKKRKSSANTSTSFFTNNLFKQQHCKVVYKCAHTYQIISHCHFDIVLFRIGNLYLQPCNVGGKLQAKGQRRISAMSNTHFDYM